MYGIKYVDSSGKTKIKDFPTEAKLQTWLDKNFDNIEVLAYSDPR